MSDGLTVETITNRPPAGLSVLDMALLGSGAAKDKVKQVLPELSETPVAGLSLMEWARLGLPSAVERVQKAVSAANQ